MTEVPPFLKKLEEQAADDLAMRAALDIVKADPPCNKPWQHTLVDQNGAVSVCCLNNWKLGNLNESSMEEIWNNPRIQQLREFFLNHDYSTCNIRCPFILNRIKEGKAYKPSPVKNELSPLLPDASSLKKQADYEMALIQNVGLLKENEYLRRLLKQVGESCPDKEVNSFVEREWARDYKGFFARQAQKNGQDVRAHATKAWSDFLQTIPDHAYLQNLKPHGGASGPLRFLFVSGGGGLGDALMYTSLIEALKKKFWPCEFTFYFMPSIITDLCEGTQLIDAVLTGDWKTHMAGISALEELDIYDMVIYSPCFFPRYVLCQNSRLTGEDNRRWITGNNSIADLLTRFTTNFGSNLLDRVLQMSYLDVLGRITGLAVNEASPLLFSPDPTALETLANMRLPPNYVTVRDGANGYDMKAAHGMGKERTNKQISAATWKSLVAQLKAQGLYVIQVGAGADPLIDGVDLDLRSKTSLSELCFLMKNALTHIDTEGGLVHFARAVHKESVALFGSTSATFFGYPQNENISTPACSPCFYSDFTWIARCPRGTKGPVCATCVDQDRILKAVQNLREQEKNTRFEVVAVQDTAHAQDRLAFIQAQLMKAPDHCEQAHHMAYIGDAKTLQDIQPALGTTRLLHAVFIGPHPDQRINHSADDLGPWLQQPTTQASYGSLWNLPLNSYAFSVVLCPDALHTTKNPQAALLELFRLVPQDGMLLVGCDTQTAASLAQGLILPPQDMAQKLGVLCREKSTSLIALRRKQTG